MNEHVTNKKPTVLVFNRYYLPAFKAGGAVRTLAAMTDQLGDEIDFKVITGDRDSYEPEPFSEKKLDCWEHHDRTSVYYISERLQYYSVLRRLIKEVDHDIIYLNSFFCPLFTLPVLILRYFRLIPSSPLVLAPRGELAEGPLKLKAAKKRGYLKLCKMLGLYNDVRWQASSAYERTDIHREMGSDHDVMIAPDLAGRSADSSVDGQAANKDVGTLRIIFISRIDLKKNLKGALALLKTIKGTIEFDIVGPISNEPYWKECQELMRSLPKNVHVSYKGMVEHDGVADLLTRYHLFLFPTTGENFGHVIYEALSAGCPVLISDRTPWRNLEQEGAGWDLPLEDEEAFISVLQRCVAMNAEDHQALSKKARLYAKTWSRAPELIEQNLALFAFDYVAA